MSKNNHPIEQEELMAYVDGELATVRAVAAAAHLERCLECQQLAADLKGVSQKMLAWEVEASDSSSDYKLAALEEEEREKEPQKAAVSDRRAWGMLFSARRLVWAGGLGVMALLLVMASVPSLLRSRRTAQFDRLETFAKISRPPDVARNTISGGTKAKDSSTYSNNFNYDASGKLSSMPLPASQQPKPQARWSEGLVVVEKDNLQHVEEQDGNASEEGDLAPSNGPLIVRTASLTVMARDKEFDKARAALEEILKRHHGYIGELNVSAPSDAGRTLTATLRVPAAQLDATLTELKALGRVEGESQGGEEVTQQYVDLQARLANAKHTEQRLTDILRQRTGKLSDVLAVELQIGRVRGEIELMQAEKKELAKQVQFATLNTTVKEEYKAPMQMAPPSTSNRFHNAAVDGYRSVVEGLVDVVLFLLSSGPSLLIWAAILFFPARWAWRKLRKHLAKNNAPAVS